MSYATTAETALILPLEPEPWRLARLRQRKDPAAAMGVPLHVTVLIPFLKRSRIDQRVKDKVLDVARSTASMTMARFSRLGMFPGSHHLLPDDPRPFAQLIERMAHAFPEAPPYEGRYTAVVPHATIAQPEADAGEIAALGLPLTLDATRIALLQREGHLWQEVLCCPLEGHPV